jgi:hypothetical protein
LELERLLKSDPFKNSKRCQILLSYLVEETLAGHGDLLKERLVGVNVFGRSPDYDTAQDPVVRSAVIEVRKRLAQFYVESGKDAAVRVDLHPGSYIPEFRVPPPTEEIPAALQQLPSKPRRRRTTFAIVAATALLVCVPVWLVFHFWPVPKSDLGRTPSAEPAVSGTAASPSPPAATGDAVRILAGDLRSDTYIDRFGNQWSSDRYFTGGNSRQGTSNLYIPPTDPELFRTMREGDFTYTIPLKRDQAYEMRLYFVEPQYRYGNRIGGDGEGSRIFQVRANGQVILDNFDIVEDSGFAPTTVRAFKDIAAAQDGMLHLQFISHQDHSLVSAIELLPSSRGTIPPIRIHTGPFYYSDSAGNRWSPDNFFIGGGLLSAGAPVTETSDPELFNSERVGNFYYAIPVPPGHYSLTIYFAETWFHNPDARVFDVSCNGAVLMHHLDLVQQVGFSHVLKKTFHGLEPNGQGKLLISFSPIVNYASVRALEVVDKGH